MADAETRNRVYQQLKEALEVVSSNGIICRAGCNGTMFGERFIHKPSCIIMQIGQAFEDDEVASDALRASDTTELRRAHEELHAKYELALSAMSHAIRVATAYQGAIRTLESQYMAPLESIGGAGYGIYQCIRCGVRTDQQSPLLLHNEWCALAILEQVKL